MKSLLLTVGIVLLAASSQAATLKPTSYTYRFAPGDPDDSNRYYDTAGTKLTDGVTFTSVWEAGVNKTVDISPLAGWRLSTSSPAMTFNFGESVIIDSITIWAADSDGAAGVGLPTHATLWNNDGYNSSFALSNPAGAGTTVPLSISGFSYTGSSLNFNLTGANQWIMLTEVTFTGSTASAIPEPSTYAALAGVAALGLVAWRRRRATASAGQDAKTGC